MKPIQCGDWHLGWGLGGHDKVGKLRYDRETKMFTWNGRCQGRHGQMGRAYQVEFKLTEWYGEEPRNYEHDCIEYIGNHHHYGLPAWSCLQPVIEQLLNKNKKETDGQQPVGKTNKRREAKAIPLVSGMFEGQ